MHPKFQQKQLENLVREINDTLVESDGKFVARSAIRQLDQNLEALTTRADDALAKYQSL